MNRVNIPLEIVKLFGKKFEGNAFVKPDILEITGVEVYKDSDKDKKLKEQYEHEKKERELQLIKQKTEYEQSLIKKIRDEENKRHEEFLMQTKLDDDNIQYVEGAVNGI